MGAFKASRLSVYVTRASFHITDAQTERHGCSAPANISGLWDPAQHPADRARVFVCAIAREHHLLIDKSGRWHGSQGALSYRTCLFMSVSFQASTRVMLLCANTGKFHVLSLQFLLFVQDCMLSHKQAHVKRLTGNPLQCSGKRIRKAPIPTESNENPDKSP